MKFLRGGLITTLSLVSLATVAPRVLAASAGANDGTPNLLTELNFNSTTQGLAQTLPTSLLASAVSGSVQSTSGVDGWIIGAQNGGELGVESIASPNASGTNVDALVGTYPKPATTGGSYLWAQYDMAALNSEDVYIEFWARMPGNKDGCKFVKIFGQDLPQGGYANTTFETDFTGVDYGSIRQISFGDGTTLDNDTQNVINFNGTYPDWIGRSYGTAVVNTPQMSNFSSADWGSVWHHFRIHVRFNSGTTSQDQTPNGEYYLEIDGKVYVDATGVYNRNPANGPIDHIGFFGWAQSDPSAFEVDYYDIRISTGGFVTQPLPTPPGNVVVK
ncbi:MAG: hypothetical protein HIU85_14430 [Proteobacteria bacterium]|nr:hypothetical protein [Pseudomonadota bacterium]